MKTMASMLLCLFLFILFFMLMNRDEICDRHDIKSFCPVKETVPSDWKTE